MDTLRIVIADEDPAWRSTLQGAVTRLGHEVVAVAEDGQQLLACCRASKPDLLITEIKLPLLDGLEVAHTLAREEPTPVVLVSACHDAEVLARLDCESVLGFLVKPVSEASLQTTIAVATLRFRSLRGLQKEAADLRQALEDRKVIERAKGILMRRLRLDEEEAFLRLRRQASQENQKVVEMARRVLAAEGIFSSLGTI